MADNNENNPASAIPKRTIKLKPGNPAAGSAISALKLTTPAASAPAAAAQTPVSTDTAKLARRTIKLVPQSGSPLSGPAAAPATPVPPAANTVSAPAAGAVSTDTAKLAKRTIKLTPASGAPAASATAPAPAPASAPTIKLSSPAPAPADQPVSTDTAKLSKRTIKLTPASGAPSASAPSAPATPSAPTIKLSSPAPATPSAPTIKLSSPAQAAPSTPTIKLSASPAPEAEGDLSTDTTKIARQTATESAPAIGSETVKLRPQSHQTIRLSKTSAGGGGLQLKKPVAKTGLAAAEAPQELTNKLNTAKPAEDSATNNICLITSIVALLLLGFTCFMMYAQYSNFFNGTSIDVPGLERKTGSASGN